SSRDRPDFSDDGGRDVRRYLENGYLPVIHSDWETGALRYRQAAFATTLLSGIGEKEDAHRGDETLALLDRIQIENTASAEQTAHLWLSLNYNVPMTLTPEGLMRLEKPSDGKDRPGLTPVRGRIETNGKGTLTYLRDYA